MKRLNDYTDIVGNETVAEIYEKARTLQGKRIVHINSTRDGGGVAEILRSLVPLMNDLGIEADWKVLEGTPDFFVLTKQFHNALQGGAVDLSEAKAQLYLRASELFSTHCAVDADCVVVHDPQPLPLIAFLKKSGPWVWRCHVDLSNPNAMLWEFLERFIIQYDSVVMSCNGYRRNGLPVEQRIICPAIDPLSSKNIDLSPEEVSRRLREAGIPTDRPLITQVSRMDCWKNPEGLLDVYELVRKEADCRLVYCYSSSIDDPEGAEMLSRTRRKAGRLIESGDVVFVEGTDQLLVNALQRFSKVILQNSIREGFCLCVTEALWKGTPVVATNVGGIPAQLREAENGFLVEPYDARGFADRVIDLLRNPDLAREMGGRGREIVRRDFLITRLLRDYLDLVNYLIFEKNSEENGAHYLTRQGFRQS